VFPGSLDDEFIHIKEEYPGKGAFFKAQFSV
jgi:hypothetical protein